MRGDGTRENAGFKGRHGFGKSPAVLVVDLIKGETNPEYPLGSDLSSVLLNTRRLVEEARKKNAPVIYVKHGYEPNLCDVGVWSNKVKSVETLRLGTKLVELDEMLEVKEEDVIIIKKQASAFFNTPLQAVFTSRKIDTVIVCGCSTSGCIRATATDACMSGYLTVIPEECVGDRSLEAHNYNLRDLDYIFADVVPLKEVISYFSAM